MHARILISIQKINKQKLHKLWTLCFFVILLAILFTFDHIMSVTPTTQAADTEQTPSSQEITIQPTIDATPTPEDQLELPAAPVVELETKNIYLSFVAKESGITYSIKGWINNLAGTPVSGITLSTNTGVTTKTGTDGSYTLTDLKPGTYTVTVQESIWYSFNPASKSVTLLAETNNVNFTALPKTGEYITNGGFEGSDGWIITKTDILAAYSTRDRHNGKRSMQAGLLSGATNTLGYSKFRQQVPIPANVKSAQLTFWMYPISSDTKNNDNQYVLVMDDKGEVLDYLVPVMARNDKTWIKYQLSLSKYAGKSIQIVFGVYNNGTGGMTGMLIDDVSLMITP